jgi:hypothetical protein
MLDVHPTKSAAAADESAHAAVVAMMLFMVAGLPGAANSETRPPVARM